MTLQEKIKNKAEGYGKLAPVFLEGAKFALENQWISVEDDLPYNHRELIHSNYTTKYVLVLNNGYPEVKYMSKLSDDKWYWMHSANVTHWMPIPKLDEYNVND